MKLNLPCKITMSRIFLIPLMVFFYLASFIPYGILVAAIIFLVAAMTDFVDGEIARKRNLVTDMGKFLDPIADKVLLCASLLLVVCDGTVLAPYGVIIAIIILARELIISAFRQIAVTKGVVMAADKLGKYKALFQDAAIFAFMIYAFFIAEKIGEGTFQFVFMIISYVLIGIATILTILSGINYIVKNRAVLK